MKFDVSESTRYAIRTALETQSADKFAYYAHMKLMLALTDKYAAVVMNPPYMGSGNMNAVLSKYVKDNYPKAKLIYLLYLWMQLFHCFPIMVNME